MNLVRLVLGSDGIAVQRQGSDGGRSQMPLG